MRKLVVLLIALFSIIMGAPVAFAAEDISLTIDANTDKAIAGEEIFFEVVASSTAQCSSFGLVLEYDTSVFQLIEGKCTIENSLISVFDKEKGFACLYEEPTAPNGSIGNFTLRVKHDVPTAVEEISGLVSANNAGVPVNIKVQGASVSIYHTGNSGQVVQPPTNSGETQDAGISTQPSGTESDADIQGTDAFTPNATKSTEASEEAFTQNATETVPENGETILPNDSSDWNSEDHQLAGSMPLPVYIFAALIVATMGFIVFLVTAVNRKSN